jgi:hypothetical protein
MTISGEEASHEPVDHAREHWPFATTIVAEVGQSHERNDLPMGFPQMWKSHRFPLENDP